MKSSNEPATRSTLGCLYHQTWPVKFARPEPASTFLWNLLKHPVELSPRETLALFPTPPLAQAPNEKADSVPSAVIKLTSFLPGWWNGDRRPHRGLFCRRRKWPLGEKRAWQKREQRKLGCSCHHLTSLRGAWEPPWPHSSLSSPRRSPGWCRLEYQVPGVRGVTAACCPPLLCLAE